MDPDPNVFLIANLIAFVHPRYTSLPPSALSAYLALVTALINVLPPSALDPPATSDSKCAAAHPSTWTQDTSDLSDDQSHPHVPVVSSFATSPRSRSHLWTQRLRGRERGRGRKRQRERERERRRRLTGIAQRRGTAGRTDKRGASRCCAIRATRVNIPMHGVGPRDTSSATRMSTTRPPEHAHHTEKPSTSHSPLAARVLCIPPWRTGTRAGQEQGQGLSALPTRLRTGLSLAALNPGALQMQGPVILGEAHTVAAHPPPVASQGSGETEREPGVGGLMESGKRGRMGRCWERFTCMQ